MRVIAGSAKGMRLITEEGEDIRPTADRVKESVFSIAQAYLPGARALDLFCGSGSLGIEALSRGAESCVFVDEREKSLKVARENLEKTGLISRAELIKSDGLRYLNSCKREFSLILLDPPYKKNLLAGALNTIDSCNILSEDGIIICESHAKDVLEDRYGALSKMKVYRYGQTIITTFKKSSVRME